MTASVTFSPRKSSAAFLSFWRTFAETSCGLNSLPRTSNALSPLGARTVLYGTRLVSSPVSSKRLPMKRLAL